ncbi:MAG: metallophosphoesterase [Acidobacteria bacterium]|nr:metallophosphoesterase [Acidobacteriota bacterium]MBI3488034.1 metallophosphoesterase [Acidobacteriota bacterium]
MPPLLALAALVVLAPGGRAQAPAPVPVSVPAAAAVESLSDGPHVLWRGPKAEVLSVREGRLEKAALGAKGMLALPGLPPLKLSPAGPRAPLTDVAGSDRVAAVSDIHGNLQGLLTLLRAHQVIDAANRWTFGKGQLVVAGDVMDRGPQVTEAYWLLRSLEAQAAARGGRVHMVMGNHESMVLTGDQRYVNPKYKQLSAGLLPGLDVLYGPDSEVGRWLRLHPALIRVGRTLFLHGGISPKLLAGKPSLQSVNESLAAIWKPGVSEEARKAMLGTHGPLWYRGLIPGADTKLGDASPEHIQALLQAFDVDRVVVGHSTLDAVTAFHGGRVIGVDAGLKDGKGGELLLLEKGQAFRGLPDGTRLPL